MKAHRNKPSKRASAPPKDVTRQLADYIAGTSYSGLPEAVVEKTKECIFDSVGCSMAGAVTRRGNILRSITLATESGCGIIGGGARTSLLEAVFCNAMTANFLELDDSYDRPGSIMFAHPGATIIPAAVAIAESNRNSGREVIEAIAVGYEICLRVGAAIQPTYHRAMNEVWGCATFQTFGAIAAAAKLLKLDVGQTLDALGIGGATAPVSSTLKVWREDHFDLHNGYGWAAQAGVRAALLAEKGYTAPPDILDGNNGFWRMYGSDQCDFDTFTAGLGSQHLILDVSFKPWAACRWEHPVMDAAKLCGTKSGLKFETLNDVAQVDRIAVKTFKAAIRSPYDNARPKNLLEAQFSTPFCAAAALMDIWLAESLFENGRLSDPRLAAMIEKVVLVPDDRAEALFPGNGGDTLAAGIEITIAGNRHEVFIIHPWGDRRNPMTKEDLAAKFLRINSGRIEKHAFTRIQTTVADLEHVTDLRPMMGALI